MHKSLILAITIVTTSLSFYLNANAATNTGQGTTPVPNPCAKHLTRTPDATITMGPNKKEAEIEVNVPNTPYKPDLTGQCTRWVVQVSMPSNATSGCANCYPWAEINAGPAQFPNSKEFEEHFIDPKIPQVRSSVNLIVTM